MSDVHFFHVGAATEVGVNAAVLLEQFHFWCSKNKANGVNFHDGLYWTYNTTKAFSKLYPYLTEKAIRTAISKLVDGGYVVTGNYNENACDRTKWYAVTEQGEALLAGTILPKGRMHLPERANGTAPKGNSLYSINSYIPDRDTREYGFQHQEDFQVDFSSTYDVPVSRAFTPPTVDEVREFCRGNTGFEHVDPEFFVNFYDARNWMVGETRIVNWKAQLRTWADRDRLKAQTEKLRQQQDANKFSDLNEGWVTLDGTY